MRFNRNLDFRDVRTEVSVQECGVSLGSVAITEPKPFPLPELVTHPWHIDSSGWRMHWKGTSAEHASRSWFCGLLSVSQSSDLQALRITEAECSLYSQYPTGGLQVQNAGPMPSARDSAPDT